MALFLFTGEKEKALEAESKLQAVKSKGDVASIIYVSSKDPQAGTKGIEKNSTDWIFASGQNSVDALLVAKQLMDKRKILEGKFLIPRENLKEFEDVKCLVFPPICKIVVETCDEHVLKAWKKFPETSNFSELLRKSLAQLPGNDVVQTVQSKMIPSDLFIHGYTKRFGGISTYPGMDSLNLVYSLKKPDSLHVVKENARRLCFHLGVNSDKYNVARANHGNIVWAYENEQPESYDGIITKTQGFTVASPAADCNMLLLADPVKKVCGAIHAGWKGILAGIVEAAIDAMIRTYECDPNDIIAALGPSLSVCCCEFGVEESKKFLTIGDNVVVWLKGKEKPHIDIRLAARILLEKSGVRPEKIDDGLNGSPPTPDIAVCTKCDPKREFFSYRRDGAKFGNQVAFICIK